MMRHPAEIAMACSALPDYSPPAELAKAICMIRRIDPYGQTLVGGVYLTSWQAIAAEALMIAMLVPEARL